MLCLSMKFTFENDLDSVKVNQHATCRMDTCTITNIIVKGRFIIVQMCTQTNTHRTNCFTWITKVVGNYVL